MVKAQVSRKLTYFHVAQDAVGYELVCLGNDVHFDAEGNASRESVAVYPYKVTGRARTPLPVNSDAGAEHWLVRRAENHPPEKTASVTASVVKGAAWVRFDLVAKSDATSSGNLIAYPSEAVVASVSVTKSQDGTDGSGAAFTSIVFFRSASKPATPTGGTYENPVPTTAGWSDAPPSGTLPLWLSRARFLPTTTNQTGWSEPGPVEDSTGIEYVFCAQETYTSAPSETHPYPASGTEWTKDPTGAVWMAVACKNNGIWSAWDVVKVKGETGGVGPRGPRGAEIPPPQQWDSYDDGFQFKSGTGSETVKHVVYYGRAGNGLALAWECVKSHTKGCGKNYPPTSAGSDIPHAGSGSIIASQYWKPVEGGPFNLLATEVMLAASAFINFLSGNSIRLFDSANNKVGEIMGGDGMLAWLGGSKEAPMWAVDVTGTQYLGGVNAGQRIVLNPVDKCLYVYDSSNAKVATHSGRVIELAEARPGSGTMTAKTAAVSFGTVPQGSSTKTVSVSGTASGAGNLQVSVPSIRLTAVRNASEASTGGSVNLKETPTTVATLTLRIYVGGSLRTSRRVATAAVGYGNDTVAGTEPETSVTVTSATVAETLPLLDGQSWEARLVLESSIDGGTGSGGSVTVAAVPAGAQLTAGFVEKVYQCEYGANGWVISYDSRNFEYHLVINGVLHTLCVANGVKVFGNDSYP